MMFLIVACRIRDVNCQTNVCQTNVIYGDSPGLPVKKAVFLTLAKFDNLNIIEKYFQ
jgi:hypothetical protein